MNLSLARGSAFFLAGVIALAPAACTPLSRSRGRW